MNNLQRNIKQLFFLALGILISSDLYSITINNQPLSSIIQPGEVLAFTFSEKDNFVVLGVEDNNFNIRHGHLFLKDMLIETFKKSASYAIRLEDYDLLPNISLYTNFHIIGKHINFEPTLLPVFTDCLLETPFISITANQVIFRDCFLIEPRVLYFLADSANADYQLIRILFHDESEIPTLITGSIDFQHNFIANPLYLTNVKEIAIQFDQRVWDNYQVS